MRDCRVLCIRGWFKLFATKREALLTLTLDRVGNLENRSNLARTKFWIGLKNRELAFS
jgi:hypothetical protein